MKALLTACLAFGLLFGLKPLPRQPDQAPNILFILADDWSYPYASIYGETYVRTPNLEKLARHGVVFENAFCAAPSCTPSRAGILTGRYPHNLGEGVNLVGKLDVGVPTYVKALREQGYAVAFERKGWGPGDFRKMGYTENPCGTDMEFAALLDKLPASQPFFFWFGTQDPHRSFDKDAGKNAGVPADKVRVPAFLPDTPEIREDLSDYISEIERLDREIGDLLKKLESSGRLENTIIVVTSDNGMPFPHAKANLYDYGTRVPLVVSSFGRQVQQNKRSDVFVNLIDLTPTFLDFAGMKNQPVMDGRSLLPILTGKKTTHRTEVFLERERHCLCRADFDYGAGYPMRAIRTKDYLYIQNLRPDRNPAGDEFIQGTPSEYGDVDGGITKMFLMDNRHLPAIKPYFDMGFEKRPAEELYVLKTDPYNIRNVAGSPAYKAVQASLKKRLEAWMKATNDPRCDGKGDEIDRYQATTRAWITRDGIILLDE